MFWLIGLIVAAVILVIKMWFDYKKVAVQTEGYATTTGITFLFLAFMALTGILSISDKLLNSLLTQIGLDLSPSPVYKWMLFAGFVVFTLAVVFILRTKSKVATDLQTTQITNNHTGSGDNVGNDKIGGDKFTGNKIVNYNYPEESQVADNPKGIGLEDPEIQTDKLPQTSSQLFGREDELALLNQCWQDNTNVLVFKAMGGTGKTALLQKWLDQLALDNFAGANAVYVHSFYSQGTAEDKQAPTELFFEEALKWFGCNKNDIPKEAHHKATKLAQLINQQRTLLILDGLEPLQHPEGGAMNGAMRDAGIKALIQNLAMQNKGLLLISSRQFINELHGKPEALVHQHSLLPLSNSAGIALFKAAKIKGSDKEFKAAIKEFKGHALSLNLIAKYLSTYEDSDIRQRTNLFALADFPEETRESNHAFSVMAAYEKQLKDTIELKILYMLGLFDRPASAAVIQVLREAEIAAISDVADSVINNDKRFKAAIDRLRQQDLLNKQDTQQPNSFNNTLDTHPLIREYFGKRLKQTQPKAWQQAHQQLYHYYKDLPEKEQPDTLEEMEPLFAAIAHGCAAGMHQEALEEVYWTRIRRETDMYIGKKLGAYGTELSALSHFFIRHWDQPTNGLKEYLNAAVLDWAAFSLRALGRLLEAVQPMQAGMEFRVKLEDWKNAAVGASNLSELQLTRGEVSLARDAAQQSVEYADKSEDEFERMDDRTVLADAQHQAGDLISALALFKKAEALQKEWQSDYPQLYSLQGYRYCNLLLGTGEWREVQQRAEQTLEWIARQDPLSEALDQLSLGRASLQQSLDTQHEAVACMEERNTGNLPDPIVRIIKLSNAKLVFRTLHTGYDEPMTEAHQRLEQAVAGLRKAGVEDYITLGLLARACFYRFSLVLNHPNKQTEAQQTIENALDDLQEAREIAQRGGMRLHLTDYHLEAARLALTIDQPVHKQSAAEHIEKAQGLIEATGYKRRLPELEYLLSCQ